MDKLKKISKSLKNVPVDIRAEVLLAQAFEKGLLQNEFIAQNDGFFKRTYIKDLYKINEVESQSYQDFMQVHLSRPGLYEALPEGLFFQAGENSKAAKTASEMAEDCRVNKIKENEVRKFFAPFENEFFLNTLQNEMVETKLLQGLRSGWLKEYFIDFWQLPHNIPTTSALVLIMFLPHAHRLAGNLPTTALVLQKIVKEPIQISLKYVKDDTLASSSYNKLGSFSLGSQLTCGNSFQEQYPLVTVTVGPIKKSKAHQYIQGGNYFALLQTFYNYFIPANAEVKTTILLQQKTAQLVLRNDEDAPILGLSSVI